MDHPGQLREFDVLVNRARRAGLTVHHYSAERLVVIIVPPAPAQPVAAPASAPPAAADPAPLPPAQA